MNRIENDDQSVPKSETIEAIKILRRAQSRVVEIVELIIHFITGIMANLVLTIGIDRNDHRSSEPQVRADRVGLCVSRVGGSIPQLHQRSCEE